MLADPHAITTLRSKCLDLDAFIVAAGFEERASHVLFNGSFGEACKAILVVFSPGVDGGDTIVQSYRDAANRQFGPENVVEVTLSQAAPDLFEQQLEELVSQLPRTCRRIGVDVSGLPSHGICMALKAVRDARPVELTTVLYTAALEYNPRFDEYEELTRRNPDEIALLPQAMALEVADNLVLRSFAGHRSQTVKSCLAVFAGYEVHRSASVIDAVSLVSAALLRNPRLLPATR